jgi:hypothetical protein
MASFVLKIKSLSTSVNRLVEGEKKDQIDLEDKIVEQETIQTTVEVINEKQSNIKGISLFN